MGSLAGRSHPRQNNAISWFEIPVWDIQRAARFYGYIYNMEMAVGRNADFSMAYFPADTGVGGALIEGPGCVPSDTGSLLYLNAGHDLNGVLARVEQAGGRVIMQKSLISRTAGYFALFIDSEGNRVALHEGPARKNAPPDVAVAQAKKAAKPATPAKKKAAKRKVAAR
jgi:uncharacterized protein